MSSKYSPSWKPLPDTLLIEISTGNFQGLLLRVKNNIHDIKKGRHPCLQSGSLNIRQVPPFIPSLPNTLLIEISTQNFQGIFHGVRKHHSWCHGWPCPPCLRSGMFNILQLPSFLTPLLDTLQISGYLPWGLQISSRNFIVIGPKSHVIEQRHITQKFEGLHMKILPPVHGNNCMFMTKMHILHAQIMFLCNFAFKITIYSLLVVFL